MMNSARPHRRASRRGSTGPPPADDYLGNYLAEVSRTARLTLDEERCLGQRIAQGDQAAIDALVEAHLRLVIAIAGRYQGLGLSVPDLVQEGNIGLMRAARKYDVTRGCRFSTYAVWWIRNEIVRALTQAALIPIPAHLADHLRRAGQSQEGRESSTTKKTSAGYVPAASIVAAAGRACRIASLDAPGRADDGTVDGAPSLSAALVDASASAPEIAAQHELRDAVMAALAQLDPTDRMILEWRFGLADGTAWTRATVGTMLGISGERVRQREARALAALHTAGLRPGLHHYVAP